ATPGICGARRAWSRTRSSPTPGNYGERVPGACRGLCRPAACTLGDEPVVVATAYGARTPRDPDRWARASVRVWYFSGDGRSVRPHACMVGRSRRRFGVTQARGTHHHHEQFRATTAEIVGDGRDRSRACTSSRCRITDQRLCATALS